jgi:acetate kinase
MFAYRVKKYIGSYSAALGGVDIIVFTGGIGENDTKTRNRVLSDLEFMGVFIDAQKAKIRGKEAVISQDDSPVKVLVVPTDEELMIARDTFDLVC